MQGSRTDLALELQEDLCDKPVKGVHVRKREDKSRNIRETTITIETEAAANEMGKPVGMYVTLESEELGQPDESFHEEMSCALLDTLERMIPKCHSILFVGLGNRGVTPDSLGPRVGDQLCITRHLIQNKIEDEGIELAAISPGVMAQTGIETACIIKSVAREIKADVILVVDALAARCPDRMGTTIQISDTGIVPGSGVGNHRFALCKDTVGCPVIAIGVPMVISVPALVESALTHFLQAMGKNTMQKAFFTLTEEERYQLSGEVVTPLLAEMYVTPKTVDDMVRRISFTISEAMNQFVHRR
ncbi:MAG: GPR endopeptidase [Lachnospiraceae bacterium]